MRIMGITVADFQGTFFHRGSHLQHRYPWRIDAHAVPVKPNGESTFPGRVLDVKGTFR